MRSQLAVGASILGLLVWSPTPIDAQSTAPAGALVARLRQSEPLTDNELAQFIERVGRAVDGLTVRVREGAISRAVSENERLGAFAILMGRFPVTDGGIRSIDGVAVRGLRAPATPANSEVEASQYLWIDLETLLPRRYELAFGVPGMGDGFVDFSYDQPAR